MSLILKTSLRADIHAAVALGTTASSTRGIAIKTMASSNVPGSVGILGAILRGDSEPPKLRRLAAIELWRANTDEARDHLLRAVESVQDPTALIGVVKALGRIGDERALRPLLSIKRDAQGVLAAQASFAASLLSFRFGLSGNDLETGTDFEEVPLIPRHRVAVLVPPKVEAEMYASCLANESYGIELSNELLQFSCPGGTWVAGFNKALTGGDAIGLVKRRKTVMAVVAARHSEDGRYSASYLILTAPYEGNSAFRIYVCRITGERMWAGTSTFIDSDQAKFELRTVGRIGVVSMELDGVLRANGAITITRAEAAVSVIEKQHPLRLGNLPI